MGKISNYASALKAKLTDYFVIASDNNGDMETKKVSTEQIGDAIASDQVHSSLNTSDKTLIGAINENASNIAALSYGIGDKLNIAGSAYSGRLTGSSKAITFFIPIEKPLDSDITSASINGDFTVYGSQGNDSITNSSSFGSWDITLKPNGILGVFSVNNAISSANGTAIVVYFTASNSASKYIEFS